MLHISFAQPCDQVQDGSGQPQPNLPPALMWKLAEQGAKEKDRSVMSLK